MRNAIEAVVGGSMGILRAAKTFDVPKTTLHRRVANKNKLIHGELKGMGAMKTALPRIIELDLVKYILQMESMLFGLSMDDVRVLAFQLAESNCLQHPFNRTVGKAGWDWVNGFRKRHPTVVLRTPEATSWARARGFNRPNVNNFFDPLEARIDEHAYPPTRIYNSDETSVTTVQTKAAKVLGLKGKRQVGCLTSAERGTLVTAEICMNAAGGYVPPMLIFPRVRMKADRVDGRSTPWFCVGVSQVRLDADRDLCGVVQAPCKTCQANRRRSDPPHSRRTQHPHEESHSHRPGKS